MRKFQARWWVTTELNNWKILTAAGLKGGAFAGYTDAHGYAFLERSKQFYASIPTSPGTGWSL